MRSRLIILLLPLTFLLQNCTYNSYDSDPLVRQWRKDSLGCIELRSEAAARTLYYRYKLKDKTSNEIIDVLGPPNKMLDNGAGLWLEYYFGTTCSGDKLIDSIEYCQASLFYIDKTKKDCDLSITCQ